LGFGTFNLLRTTWHPDAITSYGSYQLETREIVAHEKEFWNQEKKIILLPWSYILPSRYYSRHPERYFWFSPDPPPPYAFVPRLTTSAVLQHAREIAFIDPDSELLAILSGAKLSISVRQSGPINIVYAQ